MVPGFRDVPVYSFHVHTSRVFEKLELIPALDLEAEAGVEIVLALLSPIFGGCV